MSPNSSDLTPAPAPLSERLVAFLAAPLPSAESLSSSDRIAWISTAKDCVTAGAKLSPEQIKFAITLITMDRTEAAKAARSNAASARKASKPSSTEIESRIASMSAEEAADAL